MTNDPMKTTFLRALLIFLLAAVAFSSAQAAPWQAKVSPQVLSALEQGETDFLIVLAAQADLSAAASLPSKQAKGDYVYRTLNELAARTQPPVVAVLQTAQAEYRAYWVANLIWTRGDAALAQTLARRADVAYLAANPSVAADLLPPPQQPEILAPTGIEWNISKVNADDVWAAGFDGQGVVIGGQDTGYDWDHPALKSQYRGWTGVNANHDYDWHDAIHTGGSSCGADSPVPCDDYGHGTHTMGTMVGDDGGSNQIGMAPGARWIGCRNMNNGNGTPTTYTECFQWFLAPTRINGTDPRPDLAPDVINNSWGCPASEGCDANAIQAMQTVVENVRAAGIMVVASAGNAGSACNSVNDPPGVYDATFSVGATDSSDTIASFSSRGPAAHTGLPKPDVSAPGVSIRSAIPGTGYSYMQGTSMAAPHVAGQVALLLSAFPALRGDVDTLEDLIRASALPRTSGQSCGGVPGSSIPNNTYGWGRIDAWAAYQLGRTHTLTISKQGPATAHPGQPITYTLTVAHAGFLPTHGVILTDTLPQHTAFVTATLPYTRSNNLITWDLGDMAGGAHISVTLVVQPESDAIGHLINQDYGVQSEDVAPVAGNPAVISAVVEQWSLAKDGPALAAYGQPITYTLTVTNQRATASTTALVLTDTLPTHTTFVAATPPYTLTGDVVTWPLGALAAGESRRLSLVVLPDEQAGQQVVNNQYGLHSLDVSQSLGGALAVTTHLLDNLSLDKDAPASVRAGEWLTYTLTLTNQHPGQASRPLVLTDTLPAHTTFITATLPYTLTGDVVTWDVGALAAGESRTLALVVRPAANPGGQIVNAFYGAHSTEVTQTIGGPPVVTRILDQLSLAKQAAAQVGVGEWLTYTLTITNNHTNQPSGPLVLTDTLPAHTTFITATLPYTTSGDVITWLLPSLAPGQVQTVTLTVLAPATGGLLVNDTYALRTADFSFQVIGEPVYTWVLWRTYLPLLFLNTP